MAWDDAAACRDAPHPEDWLQPPGPEADRAKAVCLACPIRAECSARGAYEPAGVWGGLDSDERAYLFGPPPLPPPAHCRYCGRELPPGSRAQSCPSCARRRRRAGEVDQAQATMPRCPTCGTERSYGLPRCSVCLTSSRPTSKRIPSW